jgi:hypothetical protein
MKGGVRQAVTLNAAVQAKLGSLAALSERMLDLIVIFSTSQEH